MRSHLFTIIMCTPLMLCAISKSVLPETKPVEKKAVESAPAPVLPPAPTLSTLVNIYTAPGIAKIDGGSWVGSEHLYNLGEVGVVVEIIAPAGITLPVSEDLLKEKMVTLFKEANVPIRASLFGEQTPLPFLHLLVMVNPIDKGYVAYCALRLFEAVQLSRVQLPPEITWQVISWEKQELTIFATSQLKEQLTTVVQALTKAFADKWKAQSKKE